jgi:hypothetical protein
MIDPSTQHADAAYGPDAHGVLAIFYNRVVENTAETKIQGRPVFENVPYVKIMVPGDAYTVISEVMNDGHRDRWPQLSVAFDAKQTGLQSGTPIEEMSILTRVEVATLRAIGIVSVEMLAAYPDTKLSMMGVQRGMRDRAQEWLKGAPQVEQELRRKLGEAENENKALKAQVESLKDAVRLLEAQAGATTSKRKAA